MKKILLVAALVLGGFSATSFAKERPYNLAVDVLTVGTSSTTAASFGCAVQYGTRTYSIGNGQSSPSGYGQLRFDISLTILNPAANIICDGVYFENGLPHVIHGTTQVTMNPVGITNAFVIID